MLTTTEGYNLRTRRASDSAVNVGESFVPDSTNTTLARPTSHETPAVSPGCVSPTISGRALADPQGRASGTTALPLFSEVVSGRQSIDSAVPQSEVPVSAEKLASTDNGDGGLDTGGPWITVRYGRNGRRSATENNATNVSSTQKVNDNLSSASMLTNEQEILVNIAISQMSDEDIARIRTRTAKVRISEDDNASSVYQDTVEPKDKGKTTDPRNWGNVKLDEPEINPGIQQAMLTHFIAARDAEHFANSRTELPKDKPRTTRRTAWVEEVEDDEDPRIVRPIAKIGRSLQNVRGTSEAITDQLEAQIGRIVNGKNRTENSAEIAETRHTALTKPSEHIAPKISSHSPMSSPAMGKRALKYFDRSGGDGITWVTDPDKSSSAPIHMITDNTIRSILQLNADMASGKVSIATTMLPEHWDVIVRAFNAEGLEEKFVVIRNDKTFDQVNMPAREATIFGEVTHTYQSSPTWSSISHSVSMGSEENEMRVDQMDHSTESFDATLPSFALQPTDQSITGQHTSDFSIYGSMHAPGSVITPSRFLTADPSTHAPTIPEDLRFSKITASADVNTKSQSAEPDPRPYSKREKLQNRAGPIRSNNRSHRAQVRKQYLQLKKQSEDSEKLLMRAKEVMYMKALRDHEAMKRNRQKKDEKKRVRDKERAREEEIDDSSFAK
ncbi:hypothetical protein F5890DRAFT_1551071 [Lentinula detonsa]|uniref:Uncharacterized protein n=1 Tax=Lentinula detonsa TaxID=2804962 RepID=A0AA38Q6Q1_9AGAR|nr:hypothetical protein F5890DRAFT_1551071 [Lentinula detonsa]